MIIEKSPHHIINSHKIEKVNKIDTDTNKSNLNHLESNEFSFLDWFKGLVNPLQNLPLISGIYSSVNSENEESDRDLVQNSLGGFLYGGPIGAIVGFGNWAFNKIFDKTPTEMALDASGISQIWKDDQGEEKVTNLVNNQSNRINDNSRLYIQYVSNKPSTLKNLSKADFINSEQDNLISFSKPNVNNNSIISNKPSTLKNLSKVNFINSELDNLITSTTVNVKNNSIISNNPKFNIPRKSQEKQEKEFNLVSKVDSLKDNKLENTNINLSEENDVKFREINFSYPAWKPDKKVGSGKNQELLKKEYEKLEDRDHKTKFRVDA